MNCPNNLNETQRIDEEIVCYNPDSDSQSSEKKEIFSQDVVKILYYLSNYNTNLLCSIKRDYPSEIKYQKNYINEYYCINSKWMNYFLEFYNYKKIKTLYKENTINSEEELYIKIKENEIPLKSGFNGITLKSINFELKKKLIENYTFNVLKSGEIASYFDDFILVDKILYDKLKIYNKKQIKPDCNKYDINENIIKICLVDNIFIYKVNENVLGIGIPEIPKNTGFPIFKIQFFIIINQKYDYINEENKFDSDSEINEILRAKDLEKYLILDRKVRFEEEDKLKRIDMKFNNQKIGFLYNINDFNIENYYRRNDEIDDKDIKIKESLNRRRNDEILKQKERKEDLRFKQTLNNKKKKMQKMYDEERFKICSQNPKKSILNPIKLKIAVENDINRNITKNTRYKDLESNDTNYENNYNAKSYDKKTAKTNKSSDKYSNLPPIRNYRSEASRSIWTSDLGSTNSQEKSSFMQTKPNNLFNSNKISRKFSKEIKIDVNNLFISCNDFHKSNYTLPKVSTRSNSKYNEKEEEEDEKEEEEDEIEEVEKEEDEKEEDKKEEDKKDNKKAKKKKKKHKESSLTKEQKKILKKYKKKQKEINKRRKQIEEERKKREDKKRMEFLKRFNKVIIKHNNIVLQKEEYLKESFRLKHPDMNVY